MAATDQELQLRQSQIQTQVLAPQLRQSLKILQVPTLELRSTILEELETNPALEELPMENVSLEAETEKETSPFDKEESEEESQEVNFDSEYETLSKIDRDWNEYYAEESSSYMPSREQNMRHQHLLDSIVSEESMEDYLMQQVKFLECEEWIKDLMPFLIGSLDVRGFLASSVEEIAKTADSTEEKVETALKVLRALDPVGIGAKDLQECLLLQLEQRHMQAELPYTIVKKYFDLLIRRRVPDIARELNISTDAVQKAIESIARLDPAPARKFTAINNQVIVPDITIYKDNESWIVRSNSDFIPRLRISRSYKEIMAQEKISESERDYIREKIRSGKFLINAIHQRQETLQKITTCILEIQKSFFEQGVSQLRPLTMSHVADIIGVHETTVSRAIANKYAETPHGIFPLKYFFTSGFDSNNGESRSNRSIKERIEQLIHSENQKKPLSDQAIAQLLEKENIHIARRTVAKYREELNILPTHLRRRF